MKSANQEKAYFRCFYCGSQDQEADAFASEMGWNKIWASDYQGMNGDTWVVFRNVSDLPKFLQRYAESELEIDKKVSLNSQINSASTHDLKSSCFSYPKEKRSSREL